MANYNTDMHDYDVVVIGCGPAGQKAAIKCGKVGKRVAIVDNRQVVGGRCLHMGTIPSKTFRAAIIYLSGFYERRIYGDDYRVKDDITADDLVYRCNAIIRREIDIIRRQLERNKVDVLNGQAKFLGQNKLRVTGIVGTEDVTAEHFIICSGSQSHILRDWPFNGVNVVNTDDILELSFLPKTMVLFGGGVIGLEYACMFGLLGIDVTLVSRYPTLLPWIDSDLVEALMAHMKRTNVTFCLDTEMESIKADSKRQVTGKLKNGNDFNVEMVMIAAPRVGSTEGLGIDLLGLEADDRGYLKVNQNYQTSEPHIYAAGDVIGYPSLASTSIDQGRKAANHLLGVEDVPYEPLFPVGIYTFPDISMVGASEQELKKKGIKYEVGLGHYSDTARGQIIGDEHGFVKLLFCPETRELLGVHIIGFEATELIHMGQAVLISKGKLDYFIDTVFNYPTMAEAYKIAALNGFNKLDEALPQHI